jgi:hypothetical protein
MPLEMFALSKALVLHLETPLVVPLLAQGEIAGGTKAREPLDPRRPCWSRAP